MQKFVVYWMQSTVSNGKALRYCTFAAEAQGSILGPPFFIVYTNQLKDVLNCMVNLFAIVT